MKYPGYTSHADVDVPADSALLAAVPLAVDIDQEAHDQTALLCMRPVSSAVEPECSLET